MTEKTHAVPNGVIHYWMNDFQPGRAVLVFLPGLTADHRLLTNRSKRLNPPITCLPGMPPATANPAPL